MKLLRRLLIGSLAAIGLAACLVGTMLAAKLCRQLAWRDSQASHAADWENLGAGFDDEFPGNFEGFPGIARVADNDGDAATPAEALAVIEEEFGEASPEERAVWQEELQGHSVAAIREILSLRRKLSGSEPPLAIGNVELTAADAPALLPLPDASTAPANRLSADALGLIESAIEATRSAEQVILNNIANANTTSFKRSRVLFGDMPYRQVTIPGTTDQQGFPTPTGVALGAGVKLVATQTDVSQGRLRHTQEPLDLAIQGDGYFQINDGTRFLYTRAGSLTVNANGQFVLVSKDRGRPLEPAITIPQATMKIAISSQGIVSVLQSGQLLPNQVGQIQLARFMTPQGLLARGENLYEQSAASGNPLVSTPGQDALGEIHQGYLEEANVVVCDEMAELRRMQDQLKTLRQLHAEFSSASRSP
jgi:flagellar basal-body rod protein FlgG